MLAVEPAIFADGRMRGRGTSQDLLAHKRGDAVPSLISSGTSKMQLELIVRKLGL
jgi:hypothetical protein